MKKLPRKQKQQYVFGGCVGVLFLSSLAFFFGFFQPARSQYVRLESELAGLRLENMSRQEAVDRLEGIEGRLADASEDFLHYFGGSLIPRSVGFAALLPELERISRTAGIERGQVNYSIAEEPQYGVYAVAISIPLRGDYGSVRRFIRELERSRTFFILDSIGMARSDSGGPNTLDVGLNLTSFFAHER